MPRELQLTLREGRVLAAYLSFRRGSSIRVAKTERRSDGMIVDFDENGSAIGIEFIALSKLTMVKVNGLLQSLGQSIGSADEFWPLIKPVANRTVPAC